MFTLTINQTDSRRDGDRVPQLLKDLRHIPARLDFDRSVEDEVQGIVDCPHQAVEAAMIALRCGSWYVGIGVGPVNEPLPNQIKDASGHGLVYARRAVDRLRNSKERVPVAVEGPLADIAHDAAYCAGPVRGRVAGAGPDDPRRPRPAEGGGPGAGHHHAGRQQGRGAGAVE
jgi:hypothetical protein